jgi:hypothetical protein
LFLFEHAQNDPSIQYWVIEWFSYQYAVVGIVTRCCNGVTNNPLFLSLKTIASNKNSGSKPVNNVIDRYKISLEALKSYKSIKAIADLVC